MRVGHGPLNHTSECFTRRRNGLVGVEDEVGRLATVEADKSRKEGIEEVPTIVLNPPQAGGVMAAPEIGKQRLMRNAGIVERGPTRRASAGRSAPIQRKPDPDPGEPNKEIGNGRTTPKDCKYLKKSERDQPL